MDNLSSGCYVIDAEYNIVNMNQTAMDLYPQLKIGEKCYKCLMDLDVPCGPCPVKNKVYGPHTYTDPIRGISETVDAIECTENSQENCHALIFSTVGNRAVFAATLPTTSSELINLSLIKALTVDYYDVFSINLSTQMTSIYRHNHKPATENSLYQNQKVYTDALEDYITRYVIPEDQKNFRLQNSLDFIKSQLQEKEFLKIHYRVFLHHETHYFYRKIVRVGDQDSFTHVIIGVGCEDAEILSQLHNKKLEQNLSEIEIDSLTELYTKEAFLIHGDNLLKRYPDIDFDFCIMNLENLGMLQHQYGNSACDRLLHLIGQLLNRYNDEYTCLTYLGNGAFASFTKNDPQDIRKKAVQQFHEDILRYSAIKNLSVKWSIYIAPRKELSVAEIIAKTQYALSTIRANSHEDYVEFEQSMLDQMDWEDSIEKNFESTLQNGEFFVYYQPKYSVKDKGIVGAEALVRWIKPDGEMIPPAEFIPILERCGKINLLDQYVFQKVCVLQKRLIAAGLKNFPVSVNLSRASMFRKNLAEIYADLAAMQNVPTRNIPIEITESAAIRATAITEYANDLIKKGFVLHMDDFGSGYSSLSSLQVIPFESIKLDKSLIDYIGEDSSNSLLKHTIAYAKESGKNVIAEGVENYEQYLFLKIAGCDMIQGYYFSKPLPESEFLKLLDLPE